MFLRASILRFVAAAAVFAILNSREVRAFIPDTATPTPWTSFASGTRVKNGDPATLTWSIVPDGTLLEPDTGTTNRASNLRSFMNARFSGNAAQTDLTLQPWYHIFTDSFNRWSQLSGLSYVYESHDDGHLLPTTNENGLLGVRGDIRIGGYNIDGADGTLAFTYFPGDGGDMVMDTGDVAYFTASADNYRSFRNTFMHELGHGFGLDHVESSSVLLMGPFSDDSIDGPQLDEIRGIQYYFGDANEKSFGGQGNGAFQRATSLGTLASGGTLGVGAGASGSTQAVAPTALDFVSIANSSDADYFSFSVSQSMLLSATLTPRGGVFTHAEENATPTSYNANVRNNLALTIFGADGTSLLGTANAAAAGAVESLANLLLPAAGTYFAKISGANDNVQLYQLGLSATGLLSADFNLSGSVTAADLNLWKINQGLLTGATRNQGDANGDGAVDGADLLLWQNQLGTSAGVAVASAVPEPTGAALLIVALLATCSRKSVGGR